MTLPLAVRHHHGVPEVTGFHFLGLSVRHVARSVTYHATLLGLEQIQSRTDADGRLGEALLRDPHSGIWFGLMAHAANAGEPFSEFQTGLDHAEFRVASRTQLEAWVARLDALGISHSGIQEGSLGDLVTFRDPDNIQLEFFAPKP